MTGIREQQREQTRQTLLAEGRRLFATRGYAAVGLTEIVRAAGVTKGALYHHFPSKADLFRVVHEQVQQEVGATVATAAEAGAGPWEQFTAGCLAFLAAGTDPQIQRIMLIDAPAVLGWQEWRALDEANSARHLAESLHTLVADGIIAEQPIEPMTHLLSGAMNEAALWLARCGNPAALADVNAALLRLLQALRVSPGS